MNYHATNKNQYEGEDHIDLLADMYERGGMTYQEIGDIFNVTRQNVGIYFRRLKDRNPEKFARVKLQLPYKERIIEYIKSELSIDEILSKTDGDKKRVTIYIKKLLPKQDRKPLSKSARLTNMSISIFGDSCKPGPQFEKYVTDHLPALKNNKQLTIIVDYYFNGSLTTNRFHRGTALRKLGKIIRNIGVNKSALKEHGVLA